LFRMKPFEFSLASSN